MTGARVRGNEDGATRMKVLEAIPRLTTRCARTGGFLGPTYETIAADIGIVSKGTISRHVTELIADGLVVSTGRTRGLAVVDIADRRLDRLAEAAMRVAGLPTCPDRRDRFRRAFAETLAVVG